MIVFLFLIAPTQALSIQPVDSKLIPAGREILNYFESVYQKKMQQVSPGKMPALAECQALPNADKMQNIDPNFAKWLWALPWWANTGANPCDWISKTYNHELVLTADEIPCFACGDDSGSVDPDPVTPDPAEPDPVNPGCGGSNPSIPGCGGSDPVAPDPVDPGTVDPDPVDPDPVDPGPVEPTPPVGEMSPGANFWNIGWAPWESYFKAGVDWKTTTDPWNPTLINELKQAKIKCLRFMDWNVVNHSSVKNWNQRIPKTANHYRSENKIPCYKDQYDSATNTHNLIADADTSYGVAIEWQIDLCNRVGADMWINVPAAANADFHNQLATLIKNQLNPNLKVYIEWANEIWNWGFPTTPYAYQQAQAKEIDKIDVGGWCDPWRKYYVYESVRLFEQFEKVFGKNSERLVKVLCGQVGYKSWGAGENYYNNQSYGDMLALHNAIINPNGTKVDAFGVAPYMGGKDMNSQKNSIPHLVTGIEYVRNALDLNNETGMAMVCYESGADNWPDDGLVLTRNAQQEQIYVEYLIAMNNVLDGVIAQYCFYGGSWGLKNSAGEAAANAPKWRGWLNYWN